MRTMRVSIELQPVLAANIADEAAILNVGIGELIEEALWRFVARPKAPALANSMPTESVIQF